MSMRLPSYDAIRFVCASVMVVAVALAAAAAVVVAMEVRFESLLAHLWMKSAGSSVKPTRTWYDARCRWVHCLWPML